MEKITYHKNVIVKRTFEQTYHDAKEGNYRVWRMELLDGTTISLADYKDYIFPNDKISIAIQHSNAMESIIALHNHTSGIQISDGKHPMITKTALSLGSIGLILISFSVVILYFHLQDLNKSKAIHIFMIVLEVLPLLGAQYFIRSIFSTISKGNNALKQLL